MNNRVELAAVQPAQQLGRRHEVCELPLGEIVPLAIVAEMVADGHIRPACVVQRGDHIRPDKPGSTGHQQHAL